MLSCFFMVLHCGVCMRGSVLWCFWSIREFRVGLNPISGLWVSVRIISRLSGLAGPRVCPFFLQTWHCPASLYAVGYWCQRIREGLGRTVGVELALEWCVIVFN
jgi:hypothetical protein